MNLHRLFELESHGPDTYVGTGLEYPWGGLYGGHVVAQALRAAASTVEDGLFPHSLRAYFIRRGDPLEPVRYEVDRIRNGRSFATRRVVARQAIGAILNLEASFQRDEPASDIQTVRAPAGVAPAEQLSGDSWTSLFDRRWADPGPLDPPTGDRTGTGRILCWLKVADDLGDDRLLQCCALAYVSDDLPTDSIRKVAPWTRPGLDGVGASLDHTVWFHRPVRADRWHLHDFSCQSFVGNRGLVVGHIFAEDGTHVATVAQEVLFREPRSSE